MTELQAEPADAREAAAARLLGHCFVRPELLREALTHRSAAQGKGSNERLEFVGDRVLGLLIAEWLTERFPTEREGALGARLAVLVSQPVLASIAEAQGLAQVLDVAPAEARAGVKRRATVLADAIEAVIGALFVDAGLGPARAFVRRAFEPAIADQLAPPKDPKAALQEWAQARGLELPRYVVCARRGPPHEPVFAVTVSLAGATASGSAGTKREAEQLAATALLAQLS